MTKKPTERNEKQTSVRLPEDVKEFMIYRFGSVRGACIALTILQKAIDRGIEEGIGRHNAK